MIKNNQEILVKEIYKKILSYNKISIFSHINPDNDAYSSSLGLAIFLNALGIEAKIVGTETICNHDVIKQLQPQYNTSDSEFIENSLAIVLDLGTQKNIIDFNAFKSCKDSIRIDHHPKTETFCNLEWVDVDYCSTSEMIGWFIIFNNKNMMSKAICNALYPGILTDSGNLMFPSANDSVYKLISIFFEFNFDKQLKQNELFLKNWKNVKNNFLIAKHIKFVNNDIAYLVINKHLKKKYKITDNDSKIFLMSNVLEFKIWFSVYWSEQRNTWKVSIRSRDLPVNEIAKNFNGGGHKLASGFLIKSKKEIKKIINLCQELINNH